MKLAHVHTKLAVILIVFWLALIGGWAWRSLAQSSETPWTTPVNLSQSGAASQPVIAAAPDGSLHALWWDTVDGELYAQGTGVTETLWSKPSAVPQIFGERHIVTNTQTGKVRVTQVAPREVYLLSSARGDVHAFWYDADDQLFDILLQPGGGRTTLLSNAALNMDVTADMSGTLHLAYVRPLDGPDSPAGVYYRAMTGGAGWSAPVLVYASSYFRTVEPQKAQVSVAGEGQSQVLIAWDDPRQENSFWVHSTDGGRTWSNPQSASGSQASRAVHARVAFTPQGESLMIWQGQGTGNGCGLSQSRSADGGQTWIPPERVLVGLVQCPERWQFALGGDSRLWLLGMSQSAPVLTAWDGTAWSEPINVSLTFRDATMARMVSLGCLRLTLAGRNMGIVGCDTFGDVWAARNTVELENLMPALKPVWSALESLSDPEDMTVVEGVPALAADDQGKLYALWSESPAESEPGTVLYIAVWDVNRWSRATQVLYSTGSAAGPGAGERPAIKAEQPALAADGQDRLHAVWSGGASGSIFYSWAYVRDAASTQGWAEPAVLPAPTQVGSWPDILADPRGNVLHVIYAVPYNEGRGIYYVRSNDGGATWSEPTVVFDAAAANWGSADKPRLALDAKANVLHATWLRASLSGSVSAQAVMYARSMDGGQTWSAPIQAAEGSVDWPRVAVAGTDQVHLIWNQVRAQSGTGRPFAQVWEQYSLDGGLRWTEPAHMRGFDEVGGPVGLTSDDAGGLYLVGVGQGTGGESILLYTQWNGQSWSESQTLSLGQNARWGNSAATALVRGIGRLGVILREFTSGSDSEGQFEVAATGRDIVVASVVEPPPTFTPLPTIAPTSTSTPRPTATPKPRLAVTGIPQQIERGSLQGQMPLAVGGGLVAIIVLGVMAWRLAWMTRR